MWYHIGIKLLKNGLYCGPFVVGGGGGGGRGGKGR